MKRKEEEKRRRKGKQKDEERKQGHACRESEGKDGKRGNEGKWRIDFQETSREKIADAYR